MSPASAALAQQGTPVPATAPPHWVAEACWRAPLTSPEAARILSTAHALGLTGLAGVDVRHLFFVWDAPDPTLQLLLPLLADPALHTLTLSPTFELPLAPASAWVVDVVYRPGVLDPAGDGATARLRRLFTGDWRLRTGLRYVLAGSLTKHEARWLSTNLLSNALIQLAAVYAPDAGCPQQAWAALFRSQEAAAQVNEFIPLAALDDAALLALSARRHLALDLAEMRAIRDYAATRSTPLTDVELETLALTWSEHCSHKTFKATINFTDDQRASGGDVQQQTIHGLLNEMLILPTAQLSQRLPWVRSAFAGDAGIVAFGPRHELAIKVETHNHPSALEPFGGAQTGVGGVIRDVLGVSARPIATTDVLCFGPLDTPSTAVPAGTWHPQRIFQGVVDGVGDYANKVGVPTVNGAVLFDEGYMANPLVFCGCVGIAPRGRPRGRPAPGDMVVVIGGRTGRDGLHGATFSSDTLDDASGATLASAVQIGEPIVEKGVIDLLECAAARHLYRAMTDCGAGGLCSAVGELADPAGVSVDLDAAPLKYPGLSAWEIWLSESQERMVLAVPPAEWDAFAQLCHDEEVEVAAIGHFTDTGRLEVRHQGMLVAQLPLHVMHRGRPAQALSALWVAPQPVPARIDWSSLDCADMLLRLLATPTIASKESVIRRYDHEVQAGTVGKPILGGPASGPTDAAVVRPLPTGWRGVVLACGIAPQLGRLDPYHMALHAVDEAVRNLVSAGGQPARAVLLDNFCWGDPHQPETLGSMVRAAQGCRAAALGLAIPFISGKDSLYNEYTTTEGTRLAIPGTLLITALAPISDIRRAVSTAWTLPGNALFLVGPTTTHTGAAQIALLLGDSGGSVPEVDLRLARRVFATLARAIRRGLVRSCHDCSEGGLAVAVAEMALASGLGAVLTLPDEHPPALALFNEAPSRFVVEVAPADVDAFTLALAGLPLRRIGIVQATPHLNVVDAMGRAVLVTDLAALDAAWHTPLSAAQRSEGR